MTWTNTAGYDFNINDHAIGTMIGMEQSAYLLSAGNWDLKSVFNDWQHAYIDNTETPTQTVKTCRVSRKTITEECLTSVVWATIIKKYLFNATLRADASSKFAKGNRWDISHRYLPDKLVSVKIL